MHWTIQDCERCGGTGLEHICPECPSACDHDRLCRQCHGWGEHPVKVTPILGICDGTHQTRGEAWADIER